MGSNGYRRKKDRLQTDTILLKDVSLHFHSIFEIESLFFGKLSKAELSLFLSHERKSFKQ